MNELQIMNIHGIECYEKDGIVYLKLETCARGLGFTRIADSGNEVIRWERVEKYLAELGVPTCGHDGFIPENIFYRLAMKAKNTVAETFQAKIADEVIPSIRKHGAYMTPEAVEKILTDPDTIIRLATALKDEQTKRKKLEAENALQKQIIADFQPIKQYVDTILSSKGTMTVTQIAADYDMTAYQLNNILHDAGIQHRVGKQWILYKEHMGKGYTRTKTSVLIRHDGNTETVTSTVWSQKGRLLIHEVLTGRGILAVMDRAA